MNKLSFSLLLVGLFAVAALARTSPQIRRQFKFTPGQTYIYEYRGRQWNGLPNLADQYSGLVLDCDVILQALPRSSSAQGEEVLMKLDDVKVEQLHTQTLSNNDIRKLNSGKEQDPRQVTMYKEELSKPIRFTYLDGKIVRFTAATDEPEWSINIKKSILSLFQLDLAPSKIIKPTDERSSELDLAFNPEDLTRNSNEMPLVYPIYEESFGGICETIYQVDSIVDVDQQRQQDLVEFNDVLNVTKTVNFKNCLTDPSVSYDRHSFDVNTQTIKGRLFSKQPFTSSGYYTVPEELASKYSKAKSAFAGEDSVSSPVPVERYSFTKYNISTAPQTLVQHRQMRVPSSVDMSLVEGVYSEGKIKYDVAGDVLMSDTQQTLKLITCVPTSELARISPELSALIISTQESRNEPTVQYETIQCELSAQKLKFYQAYTKVAQIQQSLKKQNFISGQERSNELYSHKMLLPFALSASWYPIVASGHQLTEQSLEKLFNPEELAQSYENLLISLAEDVLSEDVAQSKTAGEKIIRIVNIVAFMPKYKLADVHDRIVKKIQSAKQQQRQQTQLNAKLTLTDEVSKWKVVRKLFLDSLPLAGSKQAIEMIELLIETNSVKSWEAKEICEDVPANLRYPDTEIIDGFIRISQLPQVRKNRALFASCSIAVGKMIGNAYAKSLDASYRPTTYDSAEKLPTLLRSDEIVKQVVLEADPRRQMPINWNTPEQQEVYNRLVLDEQDLTKYVKLYKQMLSKATLYHEKVIFIETLAHMKVPHVLPILEPFLTGRLSLAQCLGNQPLDINRPIEESQWYNYYARQQQRQQQSKDWSEDQALAAEECNYMRTIAIYAVAHLNRASPSKVQAMLLPVFENTYEPYQIRIAAFTTMMLNPIPEHILERIASQTWREPNKEVASFVVGAIDTMSKLTNPAMSAYKQSALKAVDSLPKQYLDTWKFSWMAGGDHFDQERQTGLNWIAETIKSNVSSIPRAAYFNFGRTHGTSRPKYDNIIELGFTSKGLESLLKEYLAYSKDASADSNIIATIFENLFDAKSDLVNYYREARDSLKQSILMTEGNSVDQNSDLNQSFFFRRQQPIEGVNSRKQWSLLNIVRPKNTLTLDADSTEEPKLTMFSKLFDSTSYHALDKREILNLLEKSDEYVKMAMEELVMGGKLHYVKMISPSNMWHMVPSQLGLPVIVTHRAPLIVSLRIDGVHNGQLTSSKLSQYLHQQATGSQVPNIQGQNFANQFAFNLTALVHPKIIHSNYRFLFSVEQANCEAYGAQVEKSYQLSLPMEVSVAFSQPQQLISMSVEPKTPAHTFWTKEAAKTFIGEVALASANADRWLGQWHLVRTPSHQHLLASADLKRAHGLEMTPTSSILDAADKLISKPKESRLEMIESLETPYKFERSFVQPMLGLELHLECATDDEQVVNSMNKPDTREKHQWTSAEQVDELDQHSKSGPFGDYLHIIDAAINRPSKYLEFYSTLKPVKSQNSPVYRFDVSLKKQKLQTSVLNNFQTSRPESRLAFQAAVPQQHMIEAMNMRLNRIQQQVPNFVETY